MALMLVRSHAQDLRPRAYIVTPVNSNAITLSYAFDEGSVDINNVLPITNSSGQFSVPALSLYHSLALFKRSANISASLPYVVGNFEGTVNGAQRNAYRSGLADSTFRLAMNLRGGPAMTPQEFTHWKQSTTVGASFSIVAPTGQYYASHVVNPGSNRWAFKPDIGVSERFGNWWVDAYAGAWLFTANTDYLTNSEFSSMRNTLTQKPIGSVEVHLSYDVKPRLWASIDGNYWYGGATSLNGLPKTDTLQSNSRIGLTLSVPFTRHQSLKFSYSDGTLIRFGGTFQTAALAWQYSWLGKAP
jgi:Putative MetA-pathway of phenol degradation